MKTRPRAKSRIRKTDTSAGGGAATLSVRLTTEEREMLAAAATLRGWTPTNLLRVAALERAAQILNTSRPTKLNFPRLAEQVAAALCGPRGFVEGGYGEPDQEFGLEDIPEFSDRNVAITPLKFSEGEVQSLRQAVRLGGPDFLALVLAECARLQKPSDPEEQLPDPIDPNSFS